MTGASTPHHLLWTLQLRAVAAKELRGRMRGRRALAVLTGYLFILCGFTLLLYLAATANRNIATSGGLMPGKIVFFGVVGLQLGLVALLAPAFSAGTISGERERQSYDLLMTTPVPAWVVVAGKLLGALAYLLLLLLAGLPVVSLGYLLGGVAPDEVAVAAVLLVVTTVAYGAVGLWFSAHVRSTIAATALTYAAVVLPLALEPVVTGLSVLIFGQLLGDSPPLLLIHIYNVLVGLNPFMAGAITAAGLAEGKGLWLFEMEFGATKALIISPWLLLTAIYLGASALLVLSAIRRIRPASARRRGEA